MHGPFIFIRITTYNRFTEHRMVNASDGLRVTRFVSLN